MKSIILTFLASAMTSFIALAQSADPVLARVRYTYINQTDTLRTGKTRTENMLLFLGKSRSLYTSYDKIKFELSEDQKSQARVMTSSISGGAPKVVKIDRSSGDWLTRTNYTFLNNEKKLIIKEEILGMAYLIEEKIPDIRWKITKDTLSFSGLACQKATAEFEGKQWTAWFAPGLPFQNGPWLLHGLPGIIVEAYDQDKRIHFEFAGFEMAKEGDFVRTNDIRKRPEASAGDINPLDVSMGTDVSAAYFENSIRLSTYRTSKTTRKAFENLKEAYKKDPAGFSRAQWGF